MGLFNNRMKNGKNHVPVWFMRQAGRYHGHYQNIKKQSDFMTMCKDPQLAFDITMGPMDEFKFDAAILFSDLLFPLEQLQMGLTYKNGPPELGRRLETLQDLKKLGPIPPAKNFYQFQAQALKKLRNELSLDKTLLGFVGAPFTLYAYAVEGGHAGNLISSKKGLFDGRFQGFLEVLLPNLEENMKIQAEGGADCICLFDTAAGELAFAEYKEFVIPVIKNLTKNFKKAYPEKAILYYSKHTHLPYLQALEDDNIDCLGIDWRMDLGQALEDLSKNYYIQGNLDPAYLHLPWEILEQQWWNIWKKVTNPEKWIAALGHGVLPKTPEENVKKSVQLIHQHFVY